MSTTQTPAPSFDQATTTWMIERILDRIDTQLILARLDIDDVLQLAATDLPKEIDVAFTETVAELAEKTTKLNGFFADITTSWTPSADGEEEQALEDDQRTGVDDAEAGPLKPVVKESYPELAATDARTYAMIARATVSNALHYGETIAPVIVQRVEDAIGMLERTLRIIASGDPDAA